MQLNFFPITINSTKYRLASEPYSVERLKELRSSYNKTHSFFRYEDKIFISNREGNDEQLFSSFVDLNANSDEQVTSSLIKHIFFRTFKDRFKNYIPADFYPFRFFSSQEKDDIIRNVLPDDLKERVAFKKMIEVQLRLIRNGTELQYGFVINTSRNWVFTKNCKELKDEGFILDNLEVLHNDYNPGLKGILEPDDDFIGTLIRTDGNEAIIHSNEGELSIPLDKLSIRKTGYNMGAYLSFRLGEEKWNSISALIKSKRHEILNNKKVHEDISKIAHSLFVEKDERGDYYFIQFRNKGEFGFSVNNRMLEVQNSINLKAPTFIFDFARTQTCATADIGLKRYGPWDSQIFQPKSPTFLCIGHKDNRGYFTSFLRKLLDGVPNSQWYDSGLQKKYEFQRITIDDRDIKSFEWEAYLDVIRSLEDTRPDLAIIEIPASFKFQKDQQNNPYYKIKAKLLKLEIPVQFITSENMRQATDVVLNSIALQIYAKLGGIPWVLPSNQTIDRELIIGVGHSWVRENAFKGAQQDRVVGLTTFMASDGQYLVSSKAKDVPFDEYFQELLNNLKSSIDKLERDLGWQPNDTIRLVFHIFKPIKNVEFDVIARLVSLYPQYRINFAFVTISKHNPFRLFDVSQPGTVRADQVKGEYVPGRGSNYKIDNYTAVVQMLGVREVKSPTHGVSNPMQIKIRLPEGRTDTADIDRLLFTDLDYIVQQLYSFTYLSWRNFLPSEIPATMLYSTLIARLLGRLRKIEGWDPDSINFKLKQRKWFL